MIFTINIFHQLKRKERFSWMGLKFMSDSIGGSFSLLFFLLNVHGG